MRLLFFVLVVANGVFFFWQSVERPGAASVASGVLPATRGNLVLLSELPGNLNASRQSAPEMLPQVGERACWWRGPFLDKAAIPSLAERSPIAVRVEEFERGADFWVYLGPFDNQASAVRVGKELRAKKLDSFVIARGNLKNAVSLGVFSDRARAERHAANYIRRGYDPEISRVPKMAERYWMVVSDGVSKSLFQKALLEVNSVPGELPPAEKKSCNLIASSKEFD